MTKKTETKLKTRFALSVLAFLLSAGGMGHAAENVTIVVAGMEKQIYLPVKLAEQLGYLKETGLDIKLLNVSSGVYAETEMLSGAAQGVVGFYDHAIDLQARGKLVQSVVQFSQVPGEALLVSTKASDIRSPADFRGRLLGVTGLGSSTNFLTRYLAAEAGVRPRDFTTVPVGAGDSFITAMRQGRIDAGMATEPTISHLVSSGAARVLIDLRSVNETKNALGGTYPGACLYMSNAWVSRHRDAVQKLATAFVKTLKYIRNHSAQEIADKMPPEYYYGASKQLYVEALTTSKSMFTVDGVMPEDGPATVLKVLNSFDKSVQGKSIHLPNTYTNEFVRGEK